MKKLLCRTLACLGALALAACSTTKVDESMTQPATTVFRNTTVITGVGHNELRSAEIVVRDGKIVSVGTASGSTPAGAKVVDLAGLTVLPGLTDAHGHIAGLGASLGQVDLVGTKSVDEIASKVAEAAKTAGRDEWVMGRGWDQNDWAVKEFPTAAMLDRAAPDRPVWLVRVDGHAGWANSAAMKLAGIIKETKAPSGGEIVRDANGNPAGVFVDNAMDLVTSKIPADTLAVRKTTISRALDRIVANGLTEVHDAGEDALSIVAMEELVKDGKFPIRAYVMLSDDADLLDTWFHRAPLIEYGGRLTIRTVKLYADGALGSRGAALLAPYSDKPDHTGLLVSTPEHLADVATRARAAGYQVATHAIGDRGVHIVLDAYEKTGAKPEDRFRIEHFQVATLDDIRRTAKDGFIASMQPTHATSDMPWAEKRVGPDRIKGAYAWRKVLNAGGRLVLGSDFPVEDVNPFYGIYSAVTRQDHEGNPPGGWYPEERLTLEEAIRGFTLDAAYAAFEESSRGTIEPGKLADFTVVETNPYEMKTADLWKTKVRYTIVGGEIVYDSTKK